MMINFHENYWGSEESFFSPKANYALYIYKSDFCVRSLYFDESALSAFIPYFAGAVTVTPPPQEAQPVETGAGLGITGPQQGSTHGKQQRARKKHGGHGGQQGGGHGGHGMKQGGGHGTKSQQTGTSQQTSQHTGAQQALWRHPASEVEETLAKIARTAAIRATTLTFELKLMINPFLC